MFYFHVHILCDFSHDLKSKSVCDFGPSWPGHSTVREFIQTAGKTLASAGAKKMLVSHDSKTRNLKSSSVFPTEMNPSQQKTQNILLSSSASRLVYKI